MIFLVSAIIIFIVSFILAILSYKSELSVPEHLKNLKITRKKTISGVILFLKNKIKHYSSSAS